MNRISLDFKNKFIYIFTDNQEGVEAMITPINKDDLLPFVKNKSILKKSDCFTFDFENNMLHINEVPSGSLMKDNFNVMESINILDLNESFDKFLNAIGFCNETLTQEDIWKAILNI